MLKNKQVNMSVQQPTTVLQHNEACYPALPVICINLHVLSPFVVVICTQHWRCWVELEFHGTDTDTDTDSDTDILADFCARIVARMSAGHARRSSPTCPCPTRALFLARILGCPLGMRTCTCVNVYCTR